MLHPSDLLEDSMRIGFLNEASNALPKYTRDHEVSIHGAVHSRLSMYYAV